MGTDYWDGLTPLAIALGGWFVPHEITQAPTRAGYVQLSIDVLSQCPEDHDALEPADRALRIWVGDFLSANSLVSLDDVADDLEACSVTLESSAFEIFGDLSDSSGTFITPQFAFQPAAGPLPEGCHVTCALRT